MASLSFWLVLVTFNLLLCSVEAVSQGGGSVQGDVDLSALARVDGVHKTGEQVQFPVEENEHGHAGEVEDETNDEGVAFVEVSGSGKLGKPRGIKKPRDTDFLDPITFRDRSKKRREKSSK